MDSVVVNVPVSQSVIHGEFVIRVVSTVSCGVDKGLYFAPQGCVSVLFRNVSLWQ